MEHIPDINNNSANNSESNDHTIQKFGRPFSLHWRFDRRVLLIVKNPTTRDCNVNYYHDVSGCKIECPLCNRHVNQDTICRHQRSNFCFRLAYEKREQSSS